MFAKMVMDESGASAAEYTMILAIVGTAIALAAFMLGGEIGEAMNDAGTCMTSKGAQCEQ